MIIAGFTGRDRAKLQEHIDELREHGVPCPDEMPVFFPIPVGLATTQRRITVSGTETSGEVEPVLLFDGDAWYVTLGSDHTDRALEKQDIAHSKAACPKVLSDEVWRFADVRQHWDRLELRNWTVRDGKRSLYQEGTCGQISPVDDILAKLHARIPSMPRAFIMCLGTLPLVGGKFVYAPRYELELHDPVLHRNLTFGYDVEMR